MSKTLDKIWFTTMGGDCIGLILVEDEYTKEKKIYIGTGEGNDEDYDADKIKQCGAKFTLPDNFKIQENSMCIENLIEEELYKRLDSIVNTIVEEKQVESKQQ